MANASLKWSHHITGILQQIEDQNDEADNVDNEEAEQAAKVDEAAPEEEDDGAWSTINKM